MTSRRGQLLIASGQLNDPNFARSIVLILQHDVEEGAMGVIINRPLNVSVAEAIGESVEQAMGIDLPIHQGGPCQGPLSVLHTEDVGNGEVVAGVHFTMDRDQIIDLMQDATGPIKYLAGYAGWAPKQLEQEIESGAWLLAPATREDVFDERQNQWSRLTTWLAVGGKIRRDQIPDDPSLN